MPIREHHLSRRGFLAASSASGVAAFAGGPSSAETAPDNTFRYEVSRSEEEWRDMLSEAEYKILRDGQTELPLTSELVSEERDGTYACRGCDLPVYLSNWKVPLDKGWVFFAHGVPNSVLLGIDGPQRIYGMGADFPNLIETHCRRCGSHLGHILLVDGEVLHCINGTSLTFSPSEA